MGDRLDVLQHDLQALLRGSYTVERELGGGGMSRVFVATETSLERRVVIKVLPPELAAAVSIDRFRREIHLAAQLQHPHIVPVLTAGEASGLLYYTMPYVEGESLRSWLKRGLVPIGEVILVLRDVLQALAYAHRRGVIHRDIKPENILLSEGGAVVADFGIAKALRAAGSDGTVTGIGIMVGTPAYSAPEQAIADPTVDHRADLYAVGTVAYEMLCGEQLFGERSPHQQLAAHAMETPAPVSQRRSEVPPRLNDLVMRCLEKDPEQRPASADVMIAELDDIASAAGHLRPSGGASSLKRRWKVALAAFGGTVVLATAGYIFVPSALLASARTLVSREQPELHVNRIIVAPFQNQTGDPHMASLGVMAADWIAEGLSHLPNLEVVDARTTLATGQVVNEIPWPLRARDKDKALAEETGAGLLVTGAFFRDGDTLRFQARVSDVISGKLRTMLPMVSGPASSPTRVLEDLRRPIVGVMRSASDTIVSKPIGSYSTPPSLEAYDEVIKGLVAYFRGDTSVFTHFERSARLDTTYATPVVLLAFARWYRFYPEVVDTLLRRVDRMRDRLSPAENAMADHIRALMRNDVGDAMRAAEEFVRATPGSMESPLLLASHALSQRLPRRAIAALARTDPDRGLNLVGGFYWSYHSLAYDQLGNAKRALEYAQQGRKRFPSATGMANVELRALVKLGRFDEARERIADYPDRFGVGRPVIAARIAAMMMALGHDREARRLLDEWRPRLEAIRDTTYRMRVAQFNFAYFASDWPALARAAAVIDSTPTASRFDVLATRAVAAVHIGRRADAERIDRELAATTAPFTFGAIPFARARIAAHLGQRDRAVALLRQAAAEGAFVHSIGTWMAYDPLLAPLRGHPVLAELDLPRQ